MNALNLMTPSVRTSSLFSLTTNSLSARVMGPCCEDASTTCHTELATSPNGVSSAGFSPSLSRLYSAGHSVLSACCETASISCLSQLTKRSAATHTASTSSVE
ncbi:hypothetical protein LSTR_LSTR017534 [Laodelphax striatellus]|uniref:Uncharacterized protein n=1 Tax=Laodelphax striatellus TaxID=195883 RepID=A0A482XRS9_LAOST|nr:hypothetical protein LSTR_LSTR017534 [Laodelphax striatellus]